MLLLPGASAGGEGINGTESLMSKYAFFVITAVKVFWRSNNGIVCTGACMGSIERDHPSECGNSRISLICIFGNKFSYQFPFLAPAHIQFSKTSSTRADDYRVSNDICGQMIVVTAIFDTNEFYFLSCSVTCHCVQETEQQAEHN